MIVLPFNKRVIMYIFNHRLEDCGAEWILCLKNKKRMAAPPKMVVLHYTAGTDCRSSAIYLSRPDVDASAHLVLGRRGEIIQLLPFDIEAWHAGRSRYAGQEGLNRCSIGIELDNLGRLDRKDGRFVAECGRMVPPEEVFACEVDGATTYWHRYTERQKAVLAEVLRVLRGAYPIRHVVGHSDVTARKQDPGPELREFMCY